MFCTDTFIDPVILRGNPDAIDLDLTRNVENKVECERLILIFMNGLRI